ncbi:hypothetical protein PG995_009861 [Apiospora arundinis]
MDMMDMEMDWSMVEIVSLVDLDQTVFQPAASPQRDQDMRVPVDCPCTACLSARQDFDWGSRDGE